jgi:hypothetical protein
LRHTKEEFMPFKYIFLFIWSLLLIQPEAKTQNAQEASCIVHLDKSFYVSGEVIWFKIYLPIETRGKAFNLKVGIVGQSGALANDFFLATEGKSQANGSFKIPFDMASGVYQLVFLALEKVSKQPVVLASVPVSIYNDLEKLNPAELKVSEPTATASNLSQDLQIEIVLDKAQYHSRESVQASIQVKDRNGTPVKADLSIAVNDWVLAGEAIFPKNNLLKGNAITGNALSDQLFIPVKLLGQAGSQSQNLISIFFPEDWQMLYTSPKQTELFLEMPSFTGQRNIQFLGHPSPSIEIQLINPFKATSSPALVYTPGILKYLEWSRQRKRIYQLYGAVENQLSPGSQVVGSTPLPPDRTLVMAEYEAFEDLATFAREISTALNFKLDRQTDRYQGRMYNPGTLTFYPSAPMFIVNGKVTRDADFVARLKINQIEKIDLYYQPEKLFANFKAIGRSGVVNIHTRTAIAIPADEEADRFNVNGLQEKVKFPMLDLAESGDQKMQPYFRPQVYWNPSLETDASGKANFSFLQPDDWSNFSIEVVAQGENGAVGQGSKKYTVVWK